jgi:hypothetical protein|tara:strand:- start:1340 stop:1546 length:207 start_codon:yes stop_codon:yes gene_type:complete
MNIAVKVLLSIVLFIIGFLCMGLWPYITVLPSIGLFIASILGIVAIWKKRKIEGEGDIFKNQDKLNKD